MNRANILIKLLEEEMYKVFVFETLLDKELRKKLLGRDVSYTKDSLANYKEITTNTVEGDDYNTLIPSAGDEVKGHVLELTKEELDMFDEWESQYDRKMVKLVSGVMAYVYLLKIEYMKDYGTTFDPPPPEDDS